MRRGEHGFTLVELIMVIVILGVIGGMVAVFMRGPIDAYFASARRAALTDTADTAVRRMARDMHRALPNSMRTPLGNQCIEFMPTKTGGRYRAEGAGALSFSAAAASFNELGSNAARSADQRIAAGDVVVVYNLGIAGASAYANNNTATVSIDPVEAGAPPETTVTFAVATLFPLASGGNRFHVVPGDEQVVSYVCDVAGTRRLLRTTATIANAAATSCTTTGALAAGSTRTVLATNVSACNFDYNTAGLQRDALLRMSLQLTDNGETVSLQHEVHVDNTP